VEAVDSHGDGLEPLFDVVPSSIVEPTAQFVTCEGSQIATSNCSEMSSNIDIVRSASVLV